MLKYLLLLPLFLHAIIIQSNRMEEILPHIDETTWTLFDIDDTILESEIQYGRAKWYWHQFTNLKKEKGIDDQAAHTILYPTWIESQEKCPIRPLEPSVPDIISQVQATGAYTIGVTARHPAVSLQTLNQLHTLSIDFTLSEPSQPIEIPRAKYLQGVWFLSDYNKKGTSIRQWIDSLEHPPAKIVFIDDSLHNLENLEEELADLATQYIGIYYTKAHERPFDPEIAQQEFRLYTAPD